MKSFAFAILFATTGLGTVPAAVAAPETPVSTAIQDIKTKVYELLGKHTATVSFEPGKSTLSAGERQNLAAVVAAVRQDATIGSAIVAAWSDQEYPASKDQSLAKAERQLADARLASVREALTNLGVSSVETHSMAEHPSWFSRLMNTEDTKVKGEGKVKDANDEMIMEIGKLLRDRGGPGKAVVLIRRVGDRVAH